MATADQAAAVGRAHWGGTFRPYQREVLEELRRRWAAGARRAWVVLPPGAGKTLVGLEAARQLGSRVVVLTPNTAIQGQWVAHWRAFERPEGGAAGTSRGLEDAVNVLTYQSLAVFDPEQENDEQGAERTLLQRLHPNGAALVAALHDAGPLTLVLDECHHLLQIWGRLLAEILAELADARVIGLTGTPPGSLTRSESELVGELFGEVLQGASIPALVRDGYLAPFDELAWLTEPTAVERDYLADSGLRFSELCTDLLAPGFAETGFLEWIRLRFHERADADTSRGGAGGGDGTRAAAAAADAGTEPDSAGAAGTNPVGTRSATASGGADAADPPTGGSAADAVPADSAPAADAHPRSASADAVHSPAPPANRVAWSRLAGREPALADAVLRLHHAGLTGLPPEARMLERHRRPPRVEDWIALLDDYVRNCLVPAEKQGRNGEAVERIRAALPAVGYRLTRRGLRAGRSPVDRVLARSAAKARAAVEITAAESASLGERLRALVLCDHERAGARPSARLRGVLAEEAGSAWEVLELLCGDERTRALHPVLVTGRTVAASPATAADFAAWSAERLPGIGLRAGAADAARGADGAEPSAHDAAAPVRIEGDWSSRVWVRLVTEYFEQGRCRILVGTRGMLGEGWDARRVNTVVDLTTATTPTAVVQGRGRALRTDPRWPEKAAHTWTVVCATFDHPKGDADWDRFVRKHQGYLGVDAEGEVMSGVAHVDPAFSAYGPPGTVEFDAVNARMLARAEDRTDVRERWRVGTPYADELLPTLRVSGAGQSTVAAGAAAAVGAAGTAAADGRAVSAPTRPAPVAAAAPKDARTGGPPARATSGAAAGASGEERSAPRIAAVAEGAPGEGRPAPAASADASGGRRVAPAPPVPANGRGSPVPTPGPTPAAGGPAVSASAPAVSAAVPDAHGAAARTPGRSPAPASLAVGTAAALAVCALLLVALPAPVPVAVACAAAAAVAAERLCARAVRVRAAAGLLAEAARPADVDRYAYAVADALAEAGHTPVGASGVRLHVDSDGTYRLTLTGGGTEAAERFRAALDDVLSPLVGTPRYIVPRFRIDPPQDAAAERGAAAAWLRGEAPPNPVVYHAVPTLLARNKAGAQTFARAWNRWVSTGEAHYTADTAGADLLRIHYGTEPSGLTTSSRLTWF